MSRELCLKARAKAECSVFIGDHETRIQGRWLGDLGKCSYSMRSDYYCPYYPYLPKVAQQLSPPVRPSKLFNFQHPYFKLKDHKFTTIRGKVHYPRVQVSSLAKITLAEEFFCYATIVNKELKALKDLSLAFLKYDAEYPGFTIESVEDFCTLLNSFNPPYYPQTTPESIKTIIYFEKW